MHVKVLGSIPSVIIPFFISSPISSTFIFLNRESGSVGSSRIPGTSVNIINFSESILDAISPATVSAFKFNASPLLSTPIGEIIGI